MVCFLAGRIGAQFGCSREHSAQCRLAPRCAVAVDLLFPDVIRAVSRRIQHFTIVIKPTMRTSYSQPNCREVIASASLAVSLGLFYCFIPLAGNVLADRHFHRQPDFFLRVSSVTSLSLDRSRYWLCSRVFSAPRNIHTQQMAATLIESWKTETRMRLVFAWIVIIGISVTGTYFGKQYSSTEERLIHEVRPPSMRKPKTTRLVPLPMF